MSISIFWFVVCLVVVAGLGYYVAVMFNRPFDVNPGDISEDVHLAVGEWDGYIPLTQPLQRGESVRLKSRGPIMRVEKHISGETIQCSWKEEGSQNRTQREFYTDTLEVVDVA